MAEHVQVQVDVSGTVQHVQPMIELATERAASANKVTGIKVKAFGGTVDEAKENFEAAITAALEIVNRLLPPTPEAKA